MIIESGKEKPRLTFADTKGGDVFEINGSTYLRMFGADWAADLLSGAIIYPSRSQVISSIIPASTVFVRKES